MRTSDPQNARALWQVLAAKLEITEEELLARATEHNDILDKSSQLSRRTIQNWARSGMAMRNLRTRQWLTEFLKSSGIAMETIEGMLSHQRDVEDLATPTREAGTKRFVKLASETEKENKYLESQRREYAGIYSIYTEAISRADTAERLFTRNMLVLWSHSNLARLVDSNGLIWDGVSVFTGESCNVIFSRRLGTVPTSIVHLVLALPHFRGARQLTGIILRNSQVSGTPIASRVLAIKSSSDESWTNDTVLLESDDASISDELRGKLRLGRFTKDDPDWEIVSGSLRNEEDLVSHQNERESF